MAYTDTWDAAFEALPANTDQVSEGAERIRDAKIAIRERLAKDHYFDIAGTDADHGEHVKVTLRTGSAPTAAANKGFVYAKDVGGKAELFYIDEDGNEVQLTSAGLIPSPIKFPATQAAVADANTLDDYEEGSWTPGLLFGGASTGITYTYQAGYYTKIGNIVICTGAIVTSSKGTATGTAQINGLPFVCVNNMGARSAGSVKTYGITFTGYITMCTNLNAQTMSLMQAPETGLSAVLTDANFADLVTLDIHITYRAV